MVKRRSIVWVLAASAGLSVVVTAATDDKDQTPLSGPKVKDHSPPGERRTLSGRGGMGDRAMGSPRVFSRAVHVLERPDAPEAIRLSDEQRAQVEAIRADFQSQMQAYRDEHREEVQTLRQQLPQRERGRIDAFLDSRAPQGGPGAGPGGAKPKGERPKGPRQDRSDSQDEMQNSSEAAAAAERLREILSGAPKPADAHARLMGVLNDAQKQAVQQEVERITKEMQDQARERAMDGDRPRLSPEERERLKEMAPEERRELVRERAKDRTKEKNPDKGIDRPREPK